MQRCMKHVPGRILAHQSRSSMNIRSENPASDNDKRSKTHPLVLLSDQMTTLNIVIR
jgi:hypothetical protein